MNEVFRLMSFSSLATRSFSRFTSASSCTMYMALRSLDSLAVIRFLSRRISLDIPEGRFLNSELIAEAGIELGQDVIEVVLVFEVFGPFFALDTPDELKRIRNTIGEFAVI